MAISNGYATLAEVRAKLRAPATNTASDSQYEQAVEAASRWVDRYCRRRFYGASETRYYTAENPYEIQVYDVTSITSLKTDEDGNGTYETTWPSTGYNLKYGENYNASLDGKPYTQIEVAENGDQTFPTAIKKGVQIIGVHGYVASTNAATGCPDPIKDATLLIAERILKRGDAPLGVAGPLALGQQPVRIPSITADPDIKALLDPYRRVG